MINVKFTMLEHRKHYSITITGTKESVLKAEAALNQNKHTLKIDLCDRHGSETEFMTEFVTHRADLRKVREWFNNNYLKVQNTDPDDRRYKQSFLWPIEDVLNEINRDRSEEWSDYVTEDLVEGWTEWVECDGYHNIKKEHLDRYQARQQTPLQ